MAPPHTALTYRDYESLPDDGRRYQVLDGVLDATPAVDVILADTTIVQPDLVYLATERSHLISRRGIEGAPTLVVEVLSPGTAAVDRGAKLRLYARADAPMALPPFADLSFVPDSLWPPRA